MRSGALRHKIRIQVAATVKDKFGATVTTWTDYRTDVMAEISQMKAYDKAAVAATWPGADVTITLRYIAGLVANMRVVGPDGTIYSILGSPNDVDGRHREHVLTCQSGVKLQ